MPYTLEFPYKRSLGPVIGGFLGALRERKILGARTRGGRVIVPPLEYDPETGEATEGSVEVGSAGVVTGWTWVPEPAESQPLESPFAWALVKLDGADTSMLHALDVPSRESLQIGMRVRVRWAEECRGHMTDIACFEPEEAA
jgi:uncharacterized OB-fold protein